MRTTWSFHTAGKLVFGSNAVDQSGDLIGRLGSKRVLIVTDRPLLEAGIVDRARRSLEAAGLGVETFADCQPEPPITAVEGAVEQARRTDCDLVFGMGGGSNMDTAKAAAVVLAHGGSIRDYAGDQQVPGPIFPLALAPTTAGTGSEVTAAAVLNDVEKGAKFALLSNHLRPKLAIVDPSLTVSCPPRVTAASGIDALAHAVEAYTAIDNHDFPLPAGESTIYQGFHPLGELLAESAIERIGRFLIRAVEDGSDLEARAGMALAATLAGMAFSNIGVAVVHALEFPLNDAVHTPHGLGCGLLLPHVMRFNAAACPERMARVALLLGADVGDADPLDAATGAADAVERIKQRIGIPRGLADVGVVEDQLAAMAEKAFALKRILRVNPRTVTQADLESILRSAL